LKIIAADSASAVLNQRFEPLQVVAASAVLIEPPYTSASFILAEPIFTEVEKGHLLVVHELELCANLLKKVQADVVHLDMSLGSLSLEELSAVSLTRMHISNKARRNVLEILPKIRKIALDIKRTHDIDVLAIGKESVPVRIAELTSGAHAVLYVAEKAVNEATTQLLGLPATCSMKMDLGKVILQSLVPTEFDLSGHAKDDKQILEKVQISEKPNPTARGFRVLEITPKKVTACA
jgi:hypothetical protein